jgi:hypothetical protein
MMIWQQTSRPKMTQPPFVDRFSRLSFIYLQESTKGAETLLAKKAFEAYAASFGVKVINYHADNGRFAEPLFLGHAETHGHTVSLCGVNAHFQNGIAEKRQDLPSACNEPMAVCGDHPLVAICPSVRQ